MKYNMFLERVEDFNEASEQERLAEMLSEQDARAEAEWETYSVSEVQSLLKLTEDEARKLVKSGIFKTYRVGNEYRTKKKSFDEQKRVVQAMLSYRNKRTITVPDVQRILGLGKTATYRLINQLYFKTYLVFGTMRVDVESFEEWYASQFHYKKVDGERPGKKYGNTIAPDTMVKVLGVPKSTAYDLMRKGKVDYILIDGHRRVLRESFENWLASQDKYKPVKAISEVENYVD